MLRVLVVATAAFLLTLAEAAISTYEGRADRQSTSSPTNKYSKIAANWAMTFEVVLMLDVYLLVREDAWVIIPIALGAWVGKYNPLEARRKKFRKHTKRRKTQPTQE